MTKRMIRLFCSRLLFRWLKQRRRPSHQPFRQVGIYKVDRLGDFVLALSAIRQIVQHEGAENCVLMISPYAEALARREFPDVVQVQIRYEYTGAISVWRYFRGRAMEELFCRGVNMLICLRHQRTARENASLAAIPASQTWGTIDFQPSSQASHWDRLSFDHGISHEEPDPGEPWELARHRTLLSHYLGRRVNHSEILPSLTPGWVPRGEFVSVAPFGSNAIRAFPRSLLVAAGRYLWHTHQLRLGLLSPPSEVPRYQELARELTEFGVPGTEVRVCASLEELIQSISLSRLVLSVETATAHLATAMDVPLVTLIGGGHLGWFGPWQRSKRQQWLTNPVSCGQCNWKCSQPGPICITGIQEGALLQAISQVLAESAA